jgi:N-methylhydantoinase B/oxoprolinase/acetone carboxylase alpha subunit
MVSDGTIIEDKGNYEIPKGQVISLTTPGGGGFGKPSFRSKAKRSIDFKNGLTTKY